MEKCSRCGKKANLVCRACGKYWDAGCHKASGGYRWSNTGVCASCGKKEVVVLRN